MHSSVRMKNMPGWIVTACIHQPDEVSPREKHMSIRHPFHDLGFEFTMLTHGNIAGLPLKRETYLFHTIYRAIIPA